MLKLYIKMEFPHSLGRDRRLLRSCVIQNTTQQASLLWAYSVEKVFLDRMCIR